MSRPTVTIKTIDKDKVYYTWQEGKVKTIRSIFLCMLPRMPRVVFNHRFLCTRACTVCEIEDFADNAHWPSTESSIILLSGS